MTVDWVLYAGMAAWTGIGLYLFLLSRRQADISLRIRRMELAEKRNNAEDSGT